MPHVTLCADVVKAGISLFYNICTNNRFVLIFSVHSRPHVCGALTSKIFLFFCVQLYSAFSCKALYNTFLKSVTHYLFTSSNPTAA